MVAYVEYAKEVHLPQFDKMETTHLFCICSYMYVNVLCISTHKFRNIHDWTTAKFSTHEELNVH